MPLRQGCETPVTNAGHLRGDKFDGNAFDGLYCTPPITQAAAIAAADLDLGFLIIARTELGAL